jgi:hypothetical protein
MPTSKRWLTKPRVFGIVGGVIVIVLLAGTMVGILITQAAPPQPFPYPHAPHIEIGIPCIYCHSGAYRGQSASLPTKAKCMGCHANIKADSPALQQLDDYASQHAEFEWVPVAIMPDFVYFTHQPHLNAGLDCINCHGDLSKMDSAEPQNGWTMGWCLSCHKSTAPEKFTKLSDCATCHK